MAHLAVVGSHSTNGVAALHTELLKTRVLKDFFELVPERFNNKTNGITQRRWLLKCNGGLADLISGRIGDGWVKDLCQLKRLTEWVEDPEFRLAWRIVKMENKRRLAQFIQRENGVQPDLASMFDCQVKRLHEYKRQLLNCLHAISLYQRLKAAPGEHFVPRTMIFAGKAAPGYFMAKLILKLINSVADVVNRDAEVGGKLKICFLANYGVSMAERIMPAADLSEQISTAGTEASGTGNMKFALNGALTIGTLDGANIEIREEVGDDNIFIFGLTSSEVAEAKRAGYNPRLYYERCPELKDAVDAVAQGQFSPDNRDLFLPVIESLLERDEYMLLADFEAYLRCQSAVSSAFQDREAWTRKSILNVANIGRFSSDRTIEEYAREIWNARPVPNTLMGS
jgi:starch phosphorylase